MNDKKLVKRQLPLLRQRNPGKRNLARPSFRRKHALSIVVKFFIHLLRATTCFLHVVLQKKLHSQREQLLIDAISPHLILSKVTGLFPYFHLLLEFLRTEI